MNDKPASQPTTPHSPSEAPIDVADLRPHMYDGIQEYDKRMPNWWLWTFYGAIIFSVFYWIIVHILGVASDPGSALRESMYEARLAALRNAPELSDAKLWAMSQDPVAIASGKKAFETTCASCHRPDLEGQIGPNLKDVKWVHGGTPLDIARIINEGVLLKGMPAWGPILGQTKIAEVSAYILSYHKEGEPIEIVPSAPPGQPVPPAASIAIPPAQAVGTPLPAVTPN